MTEPTNVMTAADVRDFVAAGRARGIIDLIRELRELDFAKLRLLLAAIEQVQQAPVLEDKIKAAMTVLKIGAELTETTVDNNLVTAIDRLMTDSMIGIIAKLIRMYAPHVLTANETIVFSVADRDAVTAQGVPWELILQLLPMLIELFQQLLEGFNQ
jgi:hypothetical protein